MPWFWTLVVGQSYKIEADIAQSVDMLYTDSVHVGLLDYLRSCTVLEHYVEEEHNTESTSASLEMLGNRALVYQPKMVNLNVPVPSFTWTALSYFYKPRVLLIFLSNRLLCQLKVNAHAHERSWKMFSKRRSTSESLIIISLLRSEISQKWRERMLCLSINTVWVICDLRKSTAGYTSGGG
jgi:hypothetical protein